jgi:hypothetical protein
MHDNVNTPTLNYKQKKQQQYFLYGIMHSNISCLIWSCVAYLLHHLIREEGWVMRGGGWVELGRVE